MSTYKILKESQYTNTYGGLSLIEFEGDQYIQMDDCMGEMFFGPLNSKQIEAFNALCGVGVSDIEVPYSDMCLSMSPTRKD